MAPGHGTSSGVPGASSSHGGIVTASAPPKTAPIPLNAAARRKQHEQRREELEKQVITARCGSCPDFFLRGTALDVIAAQVEHRRDVHGIKSFKLWKPKRDITAEARQLREEKKASRREVRERDRKETAKIKQRRHAAERDANIRRRREAVIGVMRGRDGAVLGRELHPAVADAAGCTVGQARAAARELLAEGVITYTHTPPFFWELAA